MRERSTVWIDLADKKRPAVVIEVRGELARVAYGTSNEMPSREAAVVHVATRSGRKFPLRTITYFYGANTAWELLRDLSPGEGPCARELFDEIRRLVEIHDASLDG